MVTQTQEPSQIVAGDSVEWTRAIADFLPGDGWTLHYVFLSQGKPPIAIAATQDGDGHKVTLPAATTAGWAAADYRWTAYVTKGTERKTLSSGQVRIMPDPATQTDAYDPRTENQKILDAINAVLAGELTNPLVKYKIAGREAERHSRLELLNLQAVFNHRVAMENGQGTFMGAIPIRFVEDNGIPGGGYA